MDLWTKLNFYIDYSNEYSVRKALNTLSREFNITKDPNYAREITKATEKLRSGLSQTEGVSPNLLKQIENFLKHLNSKIGGAIIDDRI